MEKLIFLLLSWSRGTSSTFYCPHVLSLPHLQAGKSRNSGSLGVLKSFSLISSCTWFKLNLNFSQFSCKFCRLGQIFDAFLVLLFLRACCCFGLVEKAFFFFECRTGETECSLLFFPAWIQPRSRFFFFFSPEVCWPGRALRKETTQNRNFPFFSPSLQFPHF